MIIIIWKYSNYSNCPQYKYLWMCTMTARVFHPLFKLSTYTLVPSTNIYIKTVKTHLYISLIRSLSLSLYHVLPVHSALVYSALACTQKQAKRVRIFNPWFGASLKCCVGWVYTHYGGRRRSPEVMWASATSLHPEVLILQPFRPIRPLGPAAWFGSS